MALGSGCRDGRLEPVGAPGDRCAGGIFAGGAAGIAFSPSGALYAIALPGSTSPAPSVTTLYVSADGGVNGQNASDWADCCKGDGSVGSYAPPAGQLGISSTGWLWAAGGEHFGYWGQVT